MLSCVCCLFFTTCDKDEAPIPGSILGTWKLTGVTTEPDGLLAFAPATYERTITFFDDTTYYTSVGICNISHDTPGGQGRYSRLKEEIASSSCDSTTDYRYELQGLELTIFYFCFEPCAERYIKVRD